MNYLITRDGQQYGPYTLRTCNGMWPREKSSSLIWRAVRE